MSRNNNKCIPQFCYFMKLINVIYDIEFTIAINHDMVSKYYKKMVKLLNICLQ